MKWPGRGKIDGYAANLTSIIGGISHTERTPFCHVEYAVTSSVAHFIKFSLAGMSYKRILERFVIFPTMS